MPSAYNLHPEFGYFCLSPSLRRLAKFGLALIVLGSIAVASQTVVQIADREPDILDRSATGAVALDPGTGVPDSLSGCHGCARGVTGFSRFESGGAGVSGCAGGRAGCAGCQHAITIGIGDRHRDQCDCLGSCKAS